MQYPGDPIYDLAAQISGNMPGIRSAIATPPGQQNGVQIVPIPGGYRVLGPNAKMPPVNATAPTPTPGVPSRQDAGAAGARLDSYFQDPSINKLGAPVAPTPPAPPAPDQAAMAMLRPPTPPTPATAYQGAQPPSVAPAATAAPPAAPIDPSVGPIGRMLPGGVRNVLTDAFSALGASDPSAPPLVAFGQAFGAAHQAGQSREDRKNALTTAAEEKTYERGRNATTDALALRAADRADEAAATTTDIKDFRFARQQGYRGTLQDWVQMKKQVGGKREIRSDANGVPRFVDTGEAVYPSDQNASGGTQFFSGKSVQAQGLNYLIGQGILNKEQAANVAAGKTVTGPNGEIIFATPEGIFTRPAGSQDGSGTPVGQDGGGAPAGQSGGEQGLIQLTGPKLSEDMRKASGFATRADAADKVISDPSVAAAGQSFAQNTEAKVPLVGNYLVSSQYQTFDQAQRDFINAVLRRESGAAINESEFANARLQYFPQPGDSPEVLKQKADNRALAIQSLHQSGDTVPALAPGKNSPPAGQQSGPVGGTTSSGVQWSVSP